MHKKIILILIFILISITNSYANTLINQTIDGYKMQIIQYDTNSKYYNIKIGVHPKDGGNLKEIMNTVGGFSGVNGVFECPKDYRECGGKNYTINERYINGQKRSVYKSTGDRVVFGWNKKFQPFLFQTGKINKNKEKEIFEGIANHPLILENGISQIKRYEKLGLINGKMKARATKNFICSDKKGKNIYFGLIYKIDIYKTADILKKIGCYNALNLDAGYSTVMIHNLKYIQKPQRNILDGIFIVPKNIDFPKLNTYVRKKVSYMMSKLKIYGYKERLKKINLFNKKLDLFLIKINNKNTIYIFDKYGKKIGKKIEINNKKDIEIIFVIKQFKRYLSLIKSKILKGNNINKINIVLK